MINYANDTVYFISYAKLPAEMSATLLHKVVGLGLVINRNTGIIEDSSCTLITNEAKAFINGILCQHNLHEEGIDSLIEELKDRFHGVSQKAICVALKGTYEKYMIWKQEQEQCNKK